MTIIWTCPECQHKNEEENEDKMDRFRCERCCKPVEDVMAILWEIRPGDPDIRHLT